jgi:hypothetical protein
VLRKRDLIILGSNLAAHEAPVALQQGSSRSRIAGDTAFRLLAEALLCIQQYSDRYLRT